MLRLKCPAQNYAWGRKPMDSNGKKGSEVAALAGAAGEDVDPAKPYAELWMGTHPSGPSIVTEADGMTLKEWIVQHPAVLGDAQHVFGPDLPFLFKVLSVETALSIQSHPDKLLAQKLHAQRPDVYKDDNHKPEMAIALTDFEALCGFVEHAELVHALQTVPELQSVVGQAAAKALESNNTKASLKAAFTELMTANSTKVAGAIRELVERLEGVRAGGARELTPKEALVLRLNKQYPLDVGVLSAFFLNLVALKTGQAIYLAANVPHAYISGELVECMATSDNVIRAGLTPKLRDTPVLCESLTYSQGLPEVLEGTPLSASRPNTTVYRPPFDEFEVVHVSMPTTTANQTPLGVQEHLPASAGPQLLLVQGGDGRAFTRSLVEDPDNTLLRQEVQLSKGGVFFIPANTPIAVEASDRGLELWLAGVNSQVFAKGGNKLSLAEQAARRAAREASSFSWVLALALGLLLLVAWAQLVQRMPWLQQEVSKWHSLGGRSAANPKPT